MAGERERQIDGKTGGIFGGKGEARGAISDVRESGVTEQFHRRRFPLEKKKFARLGEMSEGNKAFHRGKHDPLSGLRGS